MSAEPQSRNDDQQRDESPTDEQSGPQTDLDWVKSSIGHAH